MFFQLFEVLVIIAGLWFIANVIHYLVKKFNKGGFFGLAEKWLNNEKEKTSEK